MQAKKKRLTLDMAPAFQRRLKATAALKGVSMREYCLNAIDRELDEDEVERSSAETTRKPDHMRFAELRKELFGDRVFPGNSADLLREARAIRDAQMENW